MHPALIYEMSLFLSHFYILLHSMHGHRIPRQRPQHKCTLISEVAIPLVFMTLITLLWLSIALFWQHVLTRSVQQKIKAPVKVNSFSVVLLSDFVGWLCWGLTSQSTIFQSCRDGAIASWVINQYFRGVKCLAQGHNTAAVGFEPRTSRSGVRHSTTEPPRSPLSD